jgi:tRNA(Ile)-lysidine synthase
VRPLAPLADRVRLWLRRRGLEPAGVVAVSGGPDSVALLRALVDLRRETAPGLLVVAHLNHQLRGAESDADEAFVRDLHARLAAAGAAGLGLRSGRIDVAGLAHAQGANLEATARGVRYDWLARVAAETGCRAVATGHTADDQAETVLHRLLRGSGLRGLRGIAPCRTLRPGVDVIRPLLSATRSEVRAYLQAAGQDYCRDSSNCDTAYTRNRIRHELLPHLAERYNPAVVAVLARLAEQACEEYALLEAQARALLADAELPRAGALLVFDRGRLTAAPRGLLREALRLAWEREGWPLGAMGFADWERLAAVACGETPASDLPGGIGARCREGVLQLGPRECMMVGGSRPSR